MKRDLRKEVIAMVLLGVLCSATVSSVRVEAAPGEPAEFGFNRSVAVKHALAALEDFFVLSMPHISLSEYQVQNPKVAGVIGTDCNGKNRNLILVAFPARQGEGWADARMIRNKDGLITEVIGMGVNVYTWAELIQRARAPEFCE